MQIISKKKLKQPVISREIQFASFRQSYIDSEILIMI